MIFPERLERQREAFARWQQAVAAWLPNQGDQSLDREREAAFVALDRANRKLERAERKGVPLEELRG